MKKSQARFGVGVFVLGALGTQQVPVIQDTGRNVGQWNKAAKSYVQILRLHYPDSPTACPGWRGDTWAGQPLAGSLGTLKVTES